MQLSILAILRSILAILRSILAILHSILAILHSILAIQHSILAIPRSILTILHSILAILRSILAIQLSIFAIEFSIPPAIAGVQPRRTKLFSMIINKHGCISNCRWQKIFKTLNRTQMTRMLRIFADQISGHQHNPRHQRSINATI